MAAASGLAATVGGAEPWRPRQGPALRGSRFFSMGEQLRDP